MYYWYSSCAFCACGYFEGFKGIPVPWLSECVGNKCEINVQPFAKTSVFNHWQSLAHLVSSSWKVAKPKGWRRGTWWQVLWVYISVHFNGNPCCSWWFATTILEFIWYFSWCTLSNENPLSIDPIVYVNHWMMLVMWIVNVFRYIHSSLRCYLSAILW